jgi:hypothetical protein
MKDIHINSDTSYREQKENGRVGRFREAIYLLLKKWDIPLTDRQIMNFLNEDDCNNIRPEITRLKQRGFIKEVGKVKCAWTGKNVRQVMVV